YLPGPVRPGRWTLLLGVPNLRKGVIAPYVARIWFSRGAPRGFVSTFSERPLKAGLAWYRGDLHMHTAHSDGTCLAAGGTRAPCPLYRTVQAAAERGLDFIAITDHNTTSHFADMRELQPAFPALLLMPGREITTFQGHANVFGTTRFVDFRLGDRSLPTVTALLDAVRAAGGVLAVNHPALPSFEDCMGCGWTAKGTDFSRVTAIEVANGGAEKAQGGAEEGPLSGVPYWQARLNEGFRITAIGGSDNHDADIPLDTASAIGRPTTVVEANGLSEAAIIAGIAAGRVFIDLDGPRPRTIDLEAKLGERSAKMGGVLTARAGESVAFFILVHGVAAGSLEVVEDGRPIVGPSDATLGGGDIVRPFSLRTDGRRHWVRVNVRDPKGRLMLIGNPIYLRPLAR
ncbi:MAG TPA: CehA/McbA family metallohydrolase, partial [Caulobacteraceae bacterium]|nr:CehA/McbA family metallohydrolase [Caulobacteraceae bacterium]